MKLQALLIIATTALYGCQNPYQRNCEYEWLDKKVSHLLTKDTGTVIASDYRFSAKSKCQILVHTPNEIKEFDAIYWRVEE